MSTITLEQFNNFININKDKKFNGKFYSNLTNNVTQEYNLNRLPTTININNIIKITDNSLTVNIPEINKYIIYTII